jgi:hypothetical protein
MHRFHITSHLNQAVDLVRCAESTRLSAKSRKAAQRLKHIRWPLLRRGSRVRGRARQKLNALLESKLATARAWEKEKLDAKIAELRAWLDWRPYRARRRAGTGDTQTPENERGWQESDR